MIEWLNSNWIFILIGFAAGFLLTEGVIAFVRQPKSKQIEQIKNWLLYAVAKAEKELGSGTGKIKLRYVYDMFLTKFPLATNFIDFEVFSTLVDQVLVDFEKMLTDNQKLKEYIDTE